MSSAIGACVRACVCLLPWLSDDSDGNISEGDGVEG